MKDKTFSSGDKVKIPKTKSNGMYAQFLEELKNKNYTKDYLIVKKVSEYTVRLNFDSPILHLGYDLFDQSEVELYEETETKETTKTMKRFEDYNKYNILIDEVLSEEKYRAIASLVKSYGVDTEWIDNNSYDPTHPVLGICLNDFNLGCWVVDVHTRIPLSDFIECLGNCKIPKKPVHFETSEIIPDYSVRISQEGIKVGCQTITFENFKKLNEAVEEFLKS